MKRWKGKPASPKGTPVIFGAAVALLLSSTIGGARAAMLYGAENYPTTIETSAIEVALTEENAGTGGKVRTILSPDDGDSSLPELLEGLLPEGEKVRPGKRYEERLGVKNTGEIEQYVRVTVYRYWTQKDEKGEEEKVRTVSPGHILLNVLTEDWEKDEAASTEEREVFYYRRPLEAGAEAAFADGLTIAPAVGGTVTEGQDGTVTYDYNGLAFHVKVSVDAVQTHHAEDAILSAWGRRVAIDEEGVLTLRGEERI